MFAVNCLSIQTSSHRDILMNIVFASSPLCHGARHGVGSRWIISRSSSGGIRVKEEKEPVSLSPFRDSTETSFYFHDSWQLGGGKFKKSINRSCRFTLDWTVISGNEPSYGLETSIKPSQRHPFQRCLIWINEVVSWPTAIKRLLTDVFYDLYYRKWFNVGSISRSNDPLYFH